jgi:hypothetical protein
MSQSILEKNLELEVETDDFGIQTLGMQPLILYMLV